ncbi:hypothetical protein [Pseudoalteromonas luteoviolacea]|uniref:hypothetical protein n=1 Tax=Pseudoalteromonas luteoviolacea TaxID=43657 RepID=UPI001154B4FA|nr:hypothetical protein [Pseudoalteromonas luteoviolacea]TQF67820.1 hypothetical protein FLM44_21820 [Pseudoalteromonas luteoviolacea]
MIIEIHGLAKVVEDILLFSDKLTKEFKPTHYSENEIMGDKSDNEISNIERFNSFRGANSLGYFLHSQNCMIDLSIDNGLANVFIEVKRKITAAKILSLLKVFAIEGVFYAISMEWDEWRYRNGLVKEIGSSTIENWIGRDFNSYLPGLYWANLIAIPLLKKHGVDLSFLESMITHYEVIDNEFLFLQVYDSANEWQEYAPDLDEICESTDGIFSKWEIWDKLESIDDEDSYFKECRKYP